MKKNRMMRLASVLLVLVLLTTSVVSGTFAKYTTTDSANDTARVAKWGVVISAEGTLFNDAYAAGTNSKEVAYTETTATVKAVATGTNVVAPGTESNGKGLALSVTGKPEVTTKIDATISYQNIYLAGGDWGVMVKDTTVTAENFKATDLYTESSGTYTLGTGTDTFSSTAVYYRLHDAVSVTAPYYPVVYTGANVTGKTVADDSLKAVAEAIAKDLDSTATFSQQADKSYKSTITAKQYAPNTNLTTTFANLNATAISWKWDFDASGAGTYDKQDTILGDLINGLTLTDASVVYRARSSASYANTATDANGVVTCDTTEVGGTVTKLDVTITATQVD